MNWSWYCETLRHYTSVVWEVWSDSDTDSVDKHFYLDIWLGKYIYCTLISTDNMILKTVKQFCCSFLISLEIKPKIYVVVLVVWVFLTFRSLCLTFICDWNKITKLVLFSDYFDFLSLSNETNFENVLLAHSLLFEPEFQTGQTVWNIFNTHQFDKVQIVFTCRLVVL